MLLVAKLVHYIGMVVLNIEKVGDELEGLETQGLEIRHLFPITKIVLMHS
jgi:hypothetical protein